VSRHRLFELRLRRLAEIADLCIERVELADPLEDVACLRI
jgi:hypothetical protein